MPFDLPLSHFEYHWSQRQPLPVALVCVLNLPIRCHLSLSFGQKHRHQVFSLSLALNSTGLGHLVMELAHRGCESEPAVTEDLLQLLMNTTVRLLTAHCLPQMSVGGAALTACGKGIDARDIPWERWGFG